MIKQVGNTEIKSVHTLSCHSHTAKHYFCSECGIYTHHQRRSNPDEYGYNVGCLEGVNPYELGEIEVMDGVNHPSDNPS